VQSVHSDTANCSPPSSFRTVSSSITEFLDCFKEDVRRITVALPTKCCVLESIATFLLKESLGPLLPFLTAMINALLRRVCLQASKKHAIIIIAEETFARRRRDEELPSVSNLMFISKVVERVVVDYVVRHLYAHDLLQRLRSAYRCHHSTEKALLRVLS